MQEDAQKSVSEIGCRLQKTAMERLTVAGQASFMVRIDEENVLAERRSQMNEQELRAHVQIDTLPSGSAASDGCRTEQSARCVSRSKPREAAFRSSALSECPVGESI